MRLLELDLRTLDSRSHSVKKLMKTNDKSEGERERRGQKKSR